MRPLLNLALTLALTANSYAQAGLPPGTVQVEPKEAKTMLRTRVNPRYPQEAKQQRAQGTVVLTILVGVNGAVQNITVKSGPPIFQAASVEAVRQWIYQPLVRDGQILPFLTDVDVLFELR